MAGLNKKLRVQASLNFLEYPRVYEYLDEVVGEERGMRIRHLMSLGMALVDNPGSVSSSHRPVPHSPKPSATAPKATVLADVLSTLGVVGAVQHTSGKK